MQIIQPSVGDRFLAVTRVQHGVRLGKGRPLGKREVPSLTLPRPPTGQNPKVAVSPPSNRCTRWSVGKGDPPKVIKDARFDQFLKKLCETGGERYLKNFLLWDHQNFKKNADRQGGRGEGYKQKNFEKLTFLEYPSLKTIG